MRQRFLYKMVIGMAEVLVVTIASLETTASICSYTILLISAFSVTHSRIKSSCADRHNCAYKQPLIPGLQHHNDEAPGYGIHSTHALCDQALAQYRHRAGQVQSLCKLYIIMAATMLLPISPRPITPTSFISFSMVFIF